LLTDLDLGLTAPDEVDNKSVNERRKKEFCEVVYSQHVYKANLTLALILYPNTNTNLNLNANEF